MEKLEVKDTSTPRLFPNKQAWDVANRLVTEVLPFCNSVEVCGGLRRGKDEVHDVDMVVFPHDPFGLSCRLGSEHPVEISPHKYALKIDEIPVELWVAYDESQFEVLKLVRTGSHGFNINLAMKAHEKNMVLRFKSGLYGLYGAISGWNRERRRYMWYCNPLRKVHWKENEIIMTVFDDPKYLDPHNRNIDNVLFAKYEAESE